jgi:hypothetical protein
MAVSREVFDLTEDHIKLLRNANIRWDDCETGAPAIDPKRPYGNSDVECDVWEILGRIPEEEEDDRLVLSDAQREVAFSLHRETETALQVILNCKTFEPGMYARKNAWGSWKRQEEK